MEPQSLVAVILALHFAAFGWRIGREIQLEDEGRRTWLLLADYVSFLSMLAVVALCIVLPLTTGTFGKVSQGTLSAAAVFIVFYPIVLAGHYRLFSRYGRSIYMPEGDARSCRRADTDAESEAEVDNEPRSNGCGNEEEAEDDVPWLTGQEAFLLFVTVGCAALSAYLVTR